MHVRYFAAARAAAGTEEEHLDLPNGSTMACLVAAILAVERPDSPAGTPPLGRVLSRSSFLLNEVAVRSDRVTLEPGDIVLPPFAGG